MKRLGRWILLPILTLLVAGCAAEVQPPPGKKTVGVLLSGEMRMAKLAGLKQGLEEIGYSENANVKYLVKNAHDEEGLLLPLAEELVRLHPDVMVAAGHMEARVLKKATASEKIPVVFAGVASSVEQGLVESLRRPGGNLTGVDNYDAELAGKRLELLQKLLPNVRQVMVVYDPAVPPALPGLRVVENTAPRLGIGVIKEAVASREDIHRLSLRLGRGTADAILLMPSFRLEALAGEIAGMAKTCRLPVMGVNEHEAEYGCLAAYGMSFTDQGRQAARLVDKILAGQRPEKIPVETPENIELVVNLPIARQLGLSLSPVGLGFARVITDNRVDKRGAAGE